MYEPVGRPTQVVAGIACAIVSVLLLGAGLAILGVIVFDRGREPVPVGLVIFVVAMTALGAAFAPWAWRLISGRSRPAGGGLFSPFALLLIALFLVGGMVLLVLRSPWGFVNVLSIFSMVVALVALARARRQWARAAREEARLAPGGPDGDEVLRE